VITWTWSSFLAGAFTLVIAVATATYTVTSLLHTQRIAALLDRIADLKEANDELRNNGELEKRLEKPSAQSQRPINAPLRSTVPERTDRVDRPQRLQHAERPQRPARGRGLVRFVRPNAIDCVEQFIDVENEVVAPLPPTYHVVLLVTDPIGQLWSFGPAKNGLHPRVQLGVADDAGATFRLILLVTNEDVPLGQPRQTVPKALHEESLAVKRCPTVIAR
jgi:hypothetical protein